METTKNNDAGVPLFSVNCLATVQLLAVISLFTEHAIVHLQLQGNGFVTFLLSAFRGIPIFFIVIGFYIWRSLNRARDFEIFLYRRVLRLYPELWCAVALSILSVFFLSDSFNLYELGFFALGQATLFQFWTPDTVKTFACGEPNGTLIYVFIIVQFYVFAWLFKKLRPGRILLSAALAVSLALNIVTPYLPSFMPYLFVRGWSISVLPYLWLFMLGAVIREYFTAIIPIMKRFWYIGAILLIVRNIIGIDIPGKYGVISTLLTAFTFLGIAYAFPKLNLKRDISYGIFLYQMVVINVFLELGLVGDSMWYFAALAITVFISLLSHHFIGSKKLPR